MERVLSGDFAMKTLAILAVLKIAATAACYSSGNAGGIFGPSLFIGAMLGGLVGGVAHHFFPLVTAGPGAYALVGMGAAFAGIIRTPLTSVIMIFELTRDYSIIVPLMIANMISFIISYRLQREPLYEALAHQEGVFLPSGEHEHSNRLVVASVLRSTGDEEPADQARSAGVKTWPIVKDGRLAGIFDSRPEHAEHREFIHADQPLNVALEKMGAGHIDTLPVVSRADLGKFLGVITIGDVLHAYGVETEQP
jgi:CIC family chloride channel protein